MPQHIKMKHVVRRVTDENRAAEALDKASASGFKLIASEGGGGDGNVLWLVFARPAGASPIAEEPPPPPPPHTTAGGSFGGDEG